MKLLEKLGAAAVAVTAAAAFTVPAVAQFTGSDPQTMVAGWATAGHTMMAAIGSCAGGVAAYHVWTETHSFSRAGAAFAGGCLLGFGVPVLMGY